MTRRHGWAGPPTREWGLEQRGGARLWDTGDWGPQVDFGDIARLTASLLESQSQGRVYRIPE